MRSFYDYYKYLLLLEPRKRVSLLIDPGLFVVSSLFYFNDISKHNQNPLNVIYIVILIFSGTKLIYSGYKLIRNNFLKIEFKSATIISRFENYSHILPSEKEKQNGFVMCEVKQRNIIDAALYSEKINIRLQEYSAIRIELNGNYLSRVRKRITERRDVLFPLLKYKRRATKLKGQRFFNESKLCLSSDLEINSKEVNFHKGTYFDSFLTNECYGRCLISGVSTDRKLADAFDYFPVYRMGNSYQIFDISTSLLNNHIGVSTLAITSDRYLILWKQNSRNIQDPNSLVPSGSGSLDFSDLDNEYSLHRTICNGMERELKEENMILKNAIIKKTIVLGFFRWVKRCGKPQFVGITLLKNRYSDLEANEKEVSHREGIHISTIPDFAKEFNRIRNDPSYNISMPLYMNMLFLEEYCRNKADSDNELNIFLTSQFKG